MDPIQEQDDVPRKAREFLYVDVQRARSYYAQLNRGVIESVVSSEVRTAQGEAAAKLLGFGAAGGGSREAAREESRSLQDLTYVIFEELLEREGLIKDVEDWFCEPDAWRTGRVHEGLVEGQIVRYTGTLSVLDPKFVRDRFRQVVRVASAVAGVTVGPTQGQSATPPVRKGGSTKPGGRAKTSEETREGLKAAALAEMLGDFGAPQLNDVAEFVAAFTNDTIALRALPCGPEHQEYHLAGSLLSRSDYIQDEREALFSRYGTLLNDWTAVMQVARIPSPVTALPPNFDIQVWDEQANRLDRPAMETLVSELVTYIEGMGLSEGAHFPAIAVTVLAVYREFA